MRLRVKHTVLSVSLIHGRFRALAVVKDRIVGSWEAPGPVENPAQLREALREALRATRFPGRRVSFVVERFDLVHQYLRVPPMKPADLAKYLDRQARQAMPEPEEIVWRFRQGLEARGKFGILLDIWPRRFVDEVVSVCRTLGLNPTKMLPLTAVLLDQAQMLPMEKDDTCLLVSVVAERIAMIAVTGNGIPLFDRFLSPARPGVDQGERVGRELARSILFAGQQFKTTISRVWLLGENDLYSMETLQPYVEVPVIQSPIGNDPGYWLWGALSVHTPDSGNFITPAVRREPLTAFGVKVAAVLVAAFLTIGVGAVGFLEGIRVRERGFMQAMTTQSQALIQKREVWERRLRDAEARRVRMQAILETQGPQVGGPFLGYLGEVTPRQIVLHRVAIMRVSDGWEVELSGEAPSNVSVSQQLFEQWERKLIEGPFHVELADDWRTRWVNEVLYPHQGESQPGRRAFSLKGHIRWA